MKNTLSKIVVIHRGEGVREDLKNLLWKWFSKDTFVKPVHYAGLSEELEFQGNVELVVCLEGLADHAKVIVAQWKNEQTHFLFLGKPAKEIDRASYSPTLQEWKGHKMIHHL